VRRSRCEVRGNINSRKPSLALVSILQSLQRLKSPMQYICEIFRSPEIFEFFNTIRQYRTSLAAQSDARVFSGNLVPVAAAARDAGIDPVPICGLAAVPIVLSIASTRALRTTRTAEWTLR
jgi:hypothetical protein